VKFGRVVFEICEPTDRQTHRHTDTLTDGEVNIPQIGYETLLMRLR